MTNFDTYINRAVDNGNMALAARMRKEKRMASGLVRACLKRGFAVSVDNGEEIAIARSSSYRALMDALWQTDEETVVIYDPDGGKKRGWFYLVYGNDGWDLIADYSDNDICNEIWKEDMSPLSDKLAA